MVTLKMCYWMLSFNIYWISLWTYNAFISRVHGALLKYSINSSPPNAAHMRQWIASALVQIMACRLFGAKPLSKPMLGYCQIWTLMDNIQWNIKSIKKYFHSRKCITKYRLWNGGHFVGGVGGELIPVLRMLLWASYQIRKFAGCACARNAGNFFPATDFKANHRLAISACITDRASRTCRDACRDI